MSYYYSRDLEQFLDKKWCATRQQDETNYYESKNLSASDEVQSSLDCRTKYGTLESLSLLMKEIKVNNKITDHLFTLKLSLRSKIFLIKVVKLIKVTVRLIKKTVFNNYIQQGPCFIENSSDLNELNN